MSSINLLKTEEHESVSTLKRKFALKIISFVLLFFVLLSSIILFVISNRISPEAIKNEQGSILKNLTIQKEKQAKYGLLTDRLSNINQILKNRKNYTNTLNALVAQIPPGVNTTGLSVQDADITLTVNSNSLLSINDFLTKILDTVSKKHLIRDMTIETLTVDRATGTYSLSIKAKII